MKHVSKVLAAVSIALLSAGAHAEIVKYRYKAKVNTVTEYDPATDTFTNVAGSDFAGTPVAVDDMVSGFFQYDTAVGLSSFQPTQEPGSIDLSYNVGATDYISYLDETTSLAFESMPSLNQLGVTFVQDSVSVSGQFASDNIYMTRSSSDNVFYKNAILFLDDVYGHAFGDASLPTQLDLAAFQYATVSGSFLRTSDNDYMSFSAGLTSLERVDVPEPGSAALFAIAGAAWLRVRRKRG